MDGQTIDQVRDRNGADSPANLRKMLSAIVYIPEQLVVEIFHPCSLRPRTGRHVQLPQPVIPFDASINIGLWYRGD